MIYYLVSPGHYGGGTVIDTLTEDSEVSVLFLREPAVRVSLKGELNIEYHHDDSSGTSTSESNDSDSTDTDESNSTSDTPTKGTLWFHVKDDSETEYTFSVMFTVDIGYFRYTYDGVEYSTSKRYILEFNPLDIIEDESSRKETIFYEHVLNLLL